MSETLGFLDQILESGHASLKVSNAAVFTPGLTLRVYPESGGLSRGTMTTIPRPGNRPYDMYIYVDLVPAGTRAGDLIALCDLP